MLGQDEYTSCGATRLDAIAPAYRILTYADPLTEDLSRLAYSGYRRYPFSSPSEVHSAMFYLLQFHRLQLSVR